MKNRARRADRAMFWPIEDAVTETIGLDDQAGFEREPIVTADPVVSQRDGLLGRITFRATGARAGYVGFPSRSGLCVTGVENQSVKSVSEGGILDLEPMIATGPGGRGRGVEKQQKRESTRRQPRQSSRKRMNHRVSRGEPNGTHV